MGFITKFKNLFGSSQKYDLTRVDLHERYELLGKSGQGSMSSVHPARDRRTGKMFCVKILDRVKTQQFEARFAGLERPPEGFIGAALRHKNVVRTFDYGMTLEGDPFIIMELIDGVGLNFLIETNSPELEGKRADYVSELASGLEHIHQKGYLHRDICPRNVMVTKKGVVKFIDFGLAIPSTPEFCKAGNRTGIAEYLAPEVIKRVSTDHRVDLFALGVTAYEVYTGELPWERSTSKLTLQAHLNKPGHDPREYRKDLDKRTAVFLMKSIERDPRDRFQTAQEMFDVVQSLPKKY